MKKIIFFLLILSIVVIGLAVFSKSNFGKESNLSSKPIAATTQKNNNEERKKWEASPDGIHYKKWENSPEGKKVHASHDKIKGNLKDFSAMEAVVTSVTFQRENAKSGSKWLIVKINENNYMMQFLPKEFEPLKYLNVNDHITIKSRSAGYSPNHPYLILSSDYISKDHKILFKRDLSKNNGC